MSNYIEYNDRIAFHPSYYIRELVDESGLTQEDFAKRLGTTPKNLSILLKGEQCISIDIAIKLSRMIGTSIDYWLNLQRAYDSLLAEFKSHEELINERALFKDIDYKYFRTYFNLPDLPRKTDLQIEKVRNLLNVSTLSVLRNRDMAVNFRSEGKDLSDTNILKANIMVQLATNIAMKVDAPRFNRGMLDSVADYALTLTSDHQHFYSKIREALLECGVILVVLPNLPGSRVNGSTKRIGNSVVLMVNDRRLYSDSFWFTLFHEIGHIVNNDFGISFDDELGDKEEKANKYAMDKLIPAPEYEEFVSKGDYTVKSIRRFASYINRDPGIILGRLQYDRLVQYDDYQMKPLRKKYNIS